MYIGDNSYDKLFERRKELYAETASESKSFEKNSKGYRDK
jgi:hypothetical protein